MSRGKPPTGSVRRENGKWYAVITLPRAAGDQARAKRVKRLCPDKVRTREEAKAWAAWLSEQVHSGKLSLEVAPRVRAKALEEDDTDQSQGETLKRWSQRWLDARIARNIASVKDDRSRLKVHIWPELGALPMASIGKERLEQFVAHLDQKIHAGAMSWKLAKNIWALVTKAFSDAAYSKDLLLRVRGEDPTEKIVPPDTGIKKAKAFLWPGEFEALMHADSVPVRWRRLVALAVYLYCRAGELEALEWGDLDLAHGVVHIHRAVDRYRDIGTVKSTKTRATRRYTIEPELLPLLRAMKQEAGGDKAEGRIVKMPPAEALAERLRTYLERAQVHRPELHVSPDDLTRRRLTWHDLRATGITWRAVRGDDALKIQRAAGHSSLDTTQEYIREAEALAPGFGQVFPPLPIVLLTEVVAG